jgi:hypothetical protein
MAFSTHDIVPDSPTNNFCTLNPIEPNNSSLISEGNLRFYSTTGNIDVGIFSTIPALQFLYFEVYRNNCALQLYLRNEEASVYATIKEQKAPATEVWCICIDTVTGKYWAKTSAITDNIIAGTNPTGNIGTATSYRLQLWDSWSDSLTDIPFNFGQDPTFGGRNSPTTTYTDANGIGAFYHQPPTGGKALCTANLPDFTPTVNDDVPQDYFKTVIWSGTTYANATVPVGFTPDFVWAKAENANSNHRLVDSVRGGNGSLMYELASNDAGGNGTDSAITGLSNNGINLSSGNFGAVSGQDIVAWCFRAGGPPDLTSSPTKPFAKNGVQYETLSAANITAGTITPTAMSVNTDAGFSIVKYGGSNTTGLLSSSVSSATIPHGLNDCEFCIIKNLDNGNTWVVSHTSITPNVMALQDSGLAASTPPVDPTYGQITSLNSNTVTITRGSTRGDNVGENLNSWGYIMYCWHSVEGYSKFGSYTGNGSPDGPFVYTGFRPAFILLKNTDNSGAWWLIIDAQRSPYNVVDDYLYPNDAAVESSSSGDSFDFLSNGFKPRGTGGGANGSGNKIIFMAFSEQPFKFSNAR